MCHGFLKTFFFQFVLPVSVCAITFLNCIEVCHKISAVANLKASREFVAQIRLLGDSPKTPICWIKF